MFDKPGAWARMTAGEAFGMRASVARHSPLFYLHWALAKGGRAQLPGAYSERVAYVAAGSIELTARLRPPADGGAWEA